MFWTHQSHYRTCCNMLKTSATRCFGHTSHIMEHDVICSKRLPAGVLGTPSTPGTQWNMLQHAQNVCLQVFWTFFVIKAVQKRNGVNEVGLSFGVNTNTSACSWFWANPKPIFLTIFNSKIVIFLIDFSNENEFSRSGVSTKTCAGRCRQVF